MSDNPLKDLYRSKSVYLNLPSGGRFYDSGLNLSIDSELGVMPMTAVDEIKLKAPDALFNGDALFDLFKSCVPDIALADEVPTCDVDMILMGIKVATHGEMLEVTSTCAKCEKDGEYEISLPSLMASAQPIDKENVIETLNEYIQNLNHFKALMESDDFESVRNEMRSINHIKTILKGIS